MTVRTTMDATELDLVRTSLRHVLEATDAKGAHEALLAEGWAELVDADPVGAITVLAEEAGSLLSPAPIADLAVLWSLGRSGDAQAALVLPPLSHDQRHAAAATTATLDVEGLTWPGADRAHRLLIGTAEGVVVVDAGQIERVHVAGFDPTLQLSRATGQIDAASAEPIGDAAAWESALAAGRLALASQMVGAARQMLGDTATYVQERHQYGRSIGSFQTVKHRLSDVHVATTVANAAIVAAWADGGPISAAAAKALAGRAQQVASKHCQQVQGGIAFTVEHGFHNWVRRGHMLDAALGTADDLTRTIGRQLIAAGSVPRVPVLG